MQLGNKIASYLNAALTSAATSLTLPAGQGAQFPDTTNGIPFLGKIEDPATGSFEIVLVTSRAADVLSITRAREGTTAKAFPVTSIISIDATRQTFDAILRSMNYLINGCFRLNVYGSPVSLAANIYFAPRWKTGYTGTVGTNAITRNSAALGEWDADGSMKYLLRWNQTVAGTGAPSIIQCIESVHSLANGPCTVSLKSRSAAGTPTIQVIVRQHFGTGGAPSASVEQTVNVVIGTTLKHYEATFTIASLAGKTLGSNLDDRFEVEIRYPSAATFDIYVGEIQAQRSGIATDFQYRNTQHERALANRFSEMSYSDGILPGSAATAGEHRFVSRGADQLDYIYERFNVPKRKVPAVTVYNPVTGAASSWRNYSAGTDLAATVPAGPLNENSFTSLPTANTAANQFYAFHWVADAEYY